MINHRNPVYSVQNFIDRSIFHSCLLVHICLFVFIFPKSIRFANERKGLQFDLKVNPNAVMKSSAAWKKFYNFKLFTLQMFTLRWLHTDTSYFKHNIGNFSKKKWNNCELEPTLFIYYILIPLLF